MLKILTLMFRLFLFSLFCGQVFAQGIALSSKPLSNNPLLKRQAAPVAKDPEIIKLIGSIYNPANTPQGFNQKMQCWLLYEGNEAVYCMQITQTIKVKPEGLPESVYVVVSGKQYDRKLQRVDYHAASGMVGLFKIGPSSGGVRQVAYNKAISTGSYGEPPDTITLFQAGPKGRMGWAIESGYMGQGYLEGGLSIYVPFGDAVALVGGLLTVSNNEGACSPEDAKSKVCTQEVYEAYVVADTTQSDGLLYPLIADIKNAINGKQTRKRVVIPFVPAQDRYIAPEKMKD